MSLTCKEVSYSIENRRIIDQISMAVKEGECVGLIGPNGSGKSTFLKNVYRVLQPEAGLIELDGEHILRQSQRSTAQKMAVVSQESPVLFDFSVREIVWMGRSPHKRMLEPDTYEDANIVEDALQKVGLLTYAERSFMSLSGGEKQRVLIARALAQQAKFLVLDEPTNHLDIHHQLQIMDLVRNLDLTVLAALHDLNIASVYCDRICVMHDGHLVAAGTPQEVLTEQLLADVFGVNADIRVHPLTGRTHITFLPKSIQKEGVFIGKS